MTSDTFLNYLRVAQAAPFGQVLNDYLMWQKPDGDFFMVGMRSGNHKEILIYEENSSDHTQCFHYGINPHVNYQKWGGGEYDPVVELSEKVGQYHFVGRWNDPAVLMEKQGFGKVAAHGRFELAKQNIMAALQSPSMEY